MRALLWSFIALFLLPTVAAAEAFDSGDIFPGDSFSFTFTEVHEGGYMYHCHPHPWMEAMVHVMPDSDGAATTHHVDIVEPEDVQAWGYSIEHLIVEAGDTVVWNNTGAVIHTVTAEEGGHHHAHDDEDEDQGAPGPALGLVALAVVAAALRRR